MTRCRLALFAIGVFALLPAARVTAQPAPVKAHTALVHCVAVSPDGKTLATAGFDNTVKLWDIGADGALKPTKILTGHTGPVYAVAFHPTDPKIVATASQDKTARIWDVSNVKKADGKGAADGVAEVAAPKFELKSHTDIVDTIAFSPDGKSLATGGADKSVKLWNQTDGKELKALGAHDGSVYAVAFSPDSKLLASAGAGKDNLVRIWDVKEQKELTQLRGHEQPVTSVVFSGDTDVVTVSMDRTIRVWNVKNPPPLKKEEPKKEEPKKVDPKDPKKDPPKDEPKKVEKDPKEVKQLGPTTDDPYSVAWSPGTKTLAVCGYSGQITIWTLDADKPKATKVVKSPGYCVAFSGDGKLVFSGHDNGNVAINPAAAK
ncbi:MAG: hypothetical protein FJ304_03655 [Planctomycetes bacterium]|nr:hypothetical protein [Planctomycetota bacterium]